MRKLYGYIVGKCGIQPNYFFDEMTFEEVDAIIESKDDDMKQEWERTRTIAHAVISSQSTKPLKPEDVLKFEWDKDRKENNKSELSDSDRERLIKKAKNIKTE